MKLEKAIEELAELKAGCSGKDLDPAREAIQLGIEALKEHHETNKHKHTEYRLLLPGETKD